MASKVPQKREFEKTEKWCDVLKVCRYVIVIISIILILISIFELQNQLIKDILTLVLLSFTIFVYYGKWRVSTLYRNAEFIRRNGFFDNVFETKFADIESDGYYDTDEIVSRYRRFLANLHENCYYSNRISEEMFIKSEKKFIVGIIVSLIVTVTNVFEMQIAIAIIDLIITADIFEEYISLKTFHDETSKIIEECKIIWESYSESYNSPNDKTMALIMKAYAHYESTLAYESIVVDTKIFNEMNEQLKGEWEEIKNRYNMKGE